MTPAASAEEILAELLDRGLELAEVYHKRGRSRRFEIGPQGKIAALSREEGWAVRAGNRRASFFLAGTGPPRSGGPWPEPDGDPLRLPAPAPAAGWTAPADLDAPLLVESEAMSLLEGIARELSAELPGASLLRGVLEDGTSEAEIASSRGVRERLRHRAATVLLQIRGPGPGTATQTIALAEREARRFQPRALARRAATRWSVAAGGRAPERDRGEMVLAPAVAVRLLEGLLPLLVGAEGARHWAALRDRRGAVASRAVTLVDDGRLPGGVLEAPVDGEGTPTRRVRLIDEGVFRQPLLPWWQQGPAGARSSGCVRRASWRDLPRPGPTHLFLRPAAVAVASIVEEVGRGYYLIDVTGAGRFDLEEHRFALPVCGFALERGRATAPISGAWLVGSLATLLRGIQAAGRDLGFFPLDGMIGAPTLLVSGLELRRDLGRGPRPAPEPAGAPPEARRERAPGGAR